MLPFAKEFYFEVCAVLFCGRISVGDLSRYNTFVDHLNARGTQLGILKTEILACFQTASESLKFGL